MLKLLTSLFVSLPLSIFYTITGPIRRCFIRIRAELIGLRAGLAVVTTKKLSQERNTPTDDPKTE